MLRRMTVLRFCEISAAFCEPFDVRLGYLAALFRHSRLMAALEWKADVNRTHFDENQWAPFLSLLSATVPWTW
jgi:hypothetical protein